MRYFFLYYEHLSVNSVASVRNSNSSPNGWSFSYKHLFVSSVRNFSSDGWSSFTAPRRLSQSRACTNAHCLWEYAFSFHNRRKSFRNAGQSLPPIQSCPLATTGNSRECQLRSGRFNSFFAIVFGKNRRGRERDSDFRVFYQFADFSNCLSVGEVNMMPDCENVASVEL